MTLSELFITHRPFVEVVYTALILAACGYLSLHIHSLARLSGHTGLRLFRNAFLFFGLAFLTRFFMHTYTEHALILYPLFGTLIGIAGYSLMHSMVWKHCRWCGWLYPLALLFPVLDLFTSDALFFLYFSQIALFTFGIILAWRRYIPNRQGAGQLYLIAMVLFWVGWVANFLGQMLMEAYPAILVHVYLITLGIFALFIFGIRRLRRW
jgi:hypothetical protein